VVRRRNDGAVSASQRRRCRRVAQKETRRKAHTLRCGDDEDAASGVAGRRDRPIISATDH
jgi:hypothetical protein